MHWYDFLIVFVILLLLILVIIYLIKNKGCPSSTCQNCSKYGTCHKEKKLNQNNDSKYFKDR